MLFDDTGNQNWMPYLWQIYRKNKWICKYFLFNIFSNKWQIYETFVTSFFLIQKINSFTIQLLYGTIFGLSTAYILYPIIPQNNGKYLQVGTWNYMYMYRKFIFPQVLLPSGFFYLLVFYYMINYLFFKDFYFFLG